jgi:molybdopterin molybdotransferase
MIGENPSFPAAVEATLNANIASSSGREDFVPVRLFENSQGITAEPIFGKSNLIYTLAKAQGLVHISLDKTGLKAGTAVKVNLL